MNSGPEQEITRVSGQEAGALMESLLREGVAVKIRVLGRSMEPAICSGDVITVVPMRGRVCLGDIVLCRRSADPAACYVHRVVCRAGRDMWRTMGDALQSLDPPVMRANIIGRVHCVERVGSRKAADLDGMAARLRGILRAGVSLARAAWGRVRRM